MCVCEREIGLLHHLSLGEGVVVVLTINQEEASEVMEAFTHPLFLSHFLEVTDAILTFAYDLQLSISLISILHLTIPATPKKPVPLVKPDNVGPKEILVISY